MVSSEHLRTLEDTPEYPAAAPFTVWPDPGVGFRVVDLRTRVWATGAHRTLAEAFEVSYHLNQEEIARIRKVKDLSTLLHSQNS